MIDFEAYGVAQYMTDAMSADRRHVEWVRECLRRLRPRSYVEIGACFGVSTTAGIEAVKAGQLRDFHVIDPHLRPTVAEMASGLADVYLHQGTSVEVLPTLELHKPAAVFIDGDHSMAAVVPELEQVLALGPLTIFAHDVTAESAGYGGCDGAAWLWHELQRLGWRCVVDSRRRPGEHTHRGMLVATQGSDQYVQDILDAWAITCGS